MPTPWGQGLKLVGQRQIYLSGESDPDNCLWDPVHCKSGATVALWLKVIDGGLKRNGNPQHIMSLQYRSSTFSLWISKEQLLQAVLFLDEKNMEVMELPNQLKPNIWIHISAAFLCKQMGPELQESAILINGQPMSHVTKKYSYNVHKSPIKPGVVLGCRITHKIIAATKCPDTGPVLQVDELSIFPQMQTYEFFIKLFKSYTDK